MSSLVGLHRLAIVASLPIAAFVGYAINAHGARAAAALVGATLAGALVVIALNRLHVALIPLVSIVPFAGYLLVVWPTAGFSLIFDVLTLLPFAALIARWAARPEEVDLFSGTQLIVWAFLFVALLQALNPDGTGLTVTVFGARRWIVPMLLFFVAYHLDFSAPGRLPRFAGIVLAIGWLPALWGLKQHFVGLTAAEEEHVLRLGTFWVDDEVRVFSTFSGPWGMAGYMAGVALLMLPVAIAGRTLPGRVLALGGCAVATTALVFTYVRGCLVGYIVGLVFLLVAFLGIRTGMRRVLAVCAALVVGYVMFVLVLGPHIVERVSPDNVAARRMLTVLAPMRDAAMDDRMTTWASLHALALAHPLGIGIGSTSGVSARFESELTYGALHTDNVYLAVLLETGWLGGLLFLGIVLHIIVTAVRSDWFLSKGRDEWILRGALAYLIMMAVAGLATPVSFEPGASHLYWLASGLVARHVRHGYRSPVMQTSRLAMGSR